MDDERRERLTGLARRLERNVNRILGDLDNLRCDAETAKFEVIALKEDLGRESPATPLGEAVAALEPFARFYGRLAVDRIRQTGEPPDDDELFEAMAPCDDDRMLYVRDLRRAREALAKLRAWGGGREGEEEGDG